MPEFKLADDDFEVNDDNIENLPRFPKLPNRDENIQKRVLDILNGIVLTGTNVQWGIDVKTDDGSVITAGTEESEFMKILTITENVPGQSASYHITYVFLQNDTVDLVTFEQLQKFRFLQSIIRQHPLFVNIKQTIDQAIQVIKIDELEQTIEFVALSTFRSLLDEMMNDYESRKRNYSPVFGGILLFSMNRHGVNEANSANEANSVNEANSAPQQPLSMMTMACQVGELTTLVVDKLFNDPTIESMFYRITEKQRFSEYDIQRLCKMFEQGWGGQIISSSEGGDDNLTINTDDDRRDSITRFVKSVITEIKEWKDENPTLKWTRPQIQRKFFSYIESAHFASVANVEAVSKKINDGDEHSNPTYDFFSNIKTLVHSDIVLKSMMRNSSCVLSMSLTMMALRKQGVQVMDLFNMGKLKGCACYSNAASVNGMISFQNNYESVILELINGVDVDYLFTIFNSNDCNERTNANYEQFEEDCEMCFISIPAAVCLFTKRAGRIQKQIEYVDTSEINEDVNINQDDEAITRAADKPSDYDDYGETRAVDKPSDVDDYGETRAVDKPSDYDDYGETRAVNKPSDDDYGETRAVDKPSDYDDYGKTRAVGNDAGDDDYGKTGVIDDNTHSNQRYNNKHWRSDGVEAKDTFNTRSKHHKHDRHERHDFSPS